MFERVVFISKTYQVYLHVFPDGKKYVGSTSLPVRQRWNGGFGYENQERMFSAIVKFGWENVRHYILFDELDKDTARLIEAILIRKWKTATRCMGYNSVSPKIDGIDKFELPKYKKVKVDDIWEEPFETRRALYDTKRYNVASGCRPVRLIETGEVFKSAAAAAMHFGVRVSGIYRAARTPGATSGTCWIEDEDEGWRMEVPAHWEYIGQNTEEKEGSA